MLKTPVFEHFYVNRLVKFLTLQGDFFVASILLYTVYFLQAGLQIKTNPEYLLMCDKEVIEV